MDILMWIAGVNFTAFDRRGRTAVRDSSDPMGYRSMTGAAGVA